MLKRVFWALVICVPTLTVLGDDPSTPPVMPQSPQALAAIKKHDAAVDKARTIFANAQVEADRQLAAALDVALKAATRAGNFDEATKINAVKKEAEERAISGSAASEPGPPTIAIQSARYGRDQSWVDATKFTKACLKSGKLELPGNFGAQLHNGDPISGLKYIEVKCTLQGRPMTIVAFDGPGNPNLSVSPVQGGGN